MSIPCAAANVILFSANRRNQKTIRKGITNEAQKAVQIAAADFSNIRLIIWLCIVPVTQNPDPYTKKEMEPPSVHFKRFGCGMAPKCRGSLVSAVVPSLPQPVFESKVATTKSSGKIDSERPTSSPAAGAPWRMRF
jgi:hypothetical protein